MTSHDDSRPEVLGLLADLVRINSVNPNYADGVPELACAEYIEGYFRRNNIEVWRQEVLPGRPNVLARLPGKRNDRRVVFEAHMDTVSTQGMTIAPLDPQIRDGKLFGRGACDTKAGLAAMMQAMTHLAREGHQPPCEIILAATIDEEYSYRGVLAVCQGIEDHRQEQAPIGDTLQAQLAVVAEPTGLRLVVASKGVLRWKIETIGKTAHSSKPHLGRNAIEAMARVIQTLQADAERLQQDQHPLLGCPTVNIGVIQGGIQVNLVPDRCSIEVDRRLLPGETWQAVYDTYRRLMDGLTQEHPDCEVIMQPPMLTDLPLDCPVDQPAVQQLRTILGSMNLDAQAIGVPFGSDASKFAAIGIPSVIFGPGSIDQAHAAVEYVDCDQVLLATEAYRWMMLSQW